MVTLTSNKTLNSSFSFSKDLILASTDVGKINEAKKVTKPIHSIFVIDCSGSMYSSINKIKTELKNKLPSLMKTGDTVSIIYFSGKGQYGTLVNNVEVKSLLDFTSLNNSIDKLHDIGLTGFKEPLEEVKNLISQDKNKAHALFFLTDGYDNCWQSSEILSVMKELKPLLSSATFVEYGYYANKKLINEMASEVGGSHIFSKNFYSFVPIMEQHLQQSITSDKVELELVNSKFNFCFSIIDGSIIQYKIEDNIALVNPEYPVYYFSTSSYSSSLNNNKAIYASMLILSQLGMSNEIYKILNYLGDVYVIKNFINAYGKRDINKFESILLDIVKSNLSEYHEGKDLDFIPSEDAFCIFDVLTVLASDKNNKFYPNHPSFNYSNISTRKIQSSTIIPNKPIDPTGMLLEEYNKSQSSNFSTFEEAYTSYAEKLKAYNNFEAYELKYQLKYPDTGYPMSDLVFNKNRSNVSIRINKPAYVYGFPTNNKFNLPITKEDLSDSSYTQIVCTTFSSYTIIVDGIVNVQVLPISCSLDTFNTLKDNGVLSKDTTFNPDTIYEINLKSIPVINRNMIKSISAIELCELEFKYLSNQARLKVINHYYPQDKGMPELVDEKILYLKSLGISKTGFSPKFTTNHTGESYMSTELLVKIKSLSSLGKVDEAIRLYEEVEKGNKPKVTLKDEFLFPTIEFFKKNFVYSEDSLSKLISEIEVEQLVISNKLSSIKSSIILGQTWFKEFNSRSENSLVLKFNNRDYLFTIDLVDKEVLL